MHLTPDDITVFEWNGLRLNATIAFTWLVMAIIVVISRIITLRLTDSERPSRWQNMLEVLVSGVADQIRQISQQKPDRFLAFIGTLFLLILVSNVLAVVPGFQPPTASVSTTTALALCVLFAVPIYGIAERGLGGYLRTYLQPTILMLPFNIIGELSRTVALAVRLYGNVMSGTILAALLISIVPFFFPVLMQLLGLLTGIIQAYIFAVLAMVYIAAAARSHEDKDSDGSASGSDNNEIMEQQHG